MRVFFRVGEREENAPLCSRDLVWMQLSSKDDLLLFARSSVLIISYHHCLPCCFILREEEVGDCFDRKRL
jgi:hypothetical protein